MRLGTLEDTEILIILNGLLIYALLPLLLESKPASHPLHFACVSHPPTRLRLRYVLVEMRTSGGRIPLFRHRSSGRYPERIWWTSPRNLFMVPIPTNPPQSSEENGCRSWLLIPPLRIYEDGWAYGMSRYPVMHEKDYANNGMRQKSKI